MNQILIYSDSLSWGLIPETRDRLPFDKRWPGIFENGLNQKGLNVRVIENCLNGRRTAWSDPYKEGRDGSQGLAQVIETNSPLKLVILMLATNDFQSVHNLNAWQSARGVAKLINTIRQAPIEPGMPVPEIMVICPPKIIKAKGVMAEKFAGAAEKSIGLSDELEKTAQEYATYFFNAETVTESSKVDGVHLDEDQHKTLGHAVTQAVLKNIKL
mgnify:CR=1 FL=1